MDMRKIRKILGPYINRPSLRGMESNLSCLYEISRCEHDFDAVQILDYALMYIVTGRLSGTCMYALAENFPDVCKGLLKLKQRKASYDEVGAFLKGFDKRKE